MSARSGRGSAAVELAMVLPLALLMGLAVVQVGLVAKDALLVAQAAREGAREAAVTTDEGAIRQAALRGGALADAGTEIEVRRSGSVGEPVTVTVRYRAATVVPFVEWLFPQEVLITASATMRQETAG